MLPCSLRCLCLSLAALITIFIGESTCHRSFSRRGTLLFSRHRFARRSSPPLSNHQLRSIPASEIPSPATSDGQAVSRQRRSINLDQFDDNYTSQSLQQERAQAEKLWEEFIQSVDAQDVDLYPDCDDEDQSASGSRSISSVSSNSAPAQPVTISSTPTSTGKTDEDKSKSRDDDKKEKEITKKKNDAVITQSKQVKGEEAQAKKDQETVQAKKEQNAAEAKKQQDAEATKEQEAEAKKEQEAEAKKEKEAEDKKEQEAEAKKEQEAEAKKEQEAEAKKEQEAEAKKEQQASEAKKKQDADNEKAKKGKEEYQVTDLKKIPGTSVTTGTAHRAKDETYNSSPSSEEHTGDATFFTPDVGACGDRNSPEDHIVAVSHLLYDSYPSEGGNPNTNAICHKMIRATYKGKSVDVKVTDRCEGCDMYSLDFTESAFEQLGSKDEGRLHGMTWTFI